MIIFSRLRETVIVRDKLNKTQLRYLLILLMLLLSRAAVHEAGCEVNPTTGSKEKQKKLAEIVEMINAGHAIHQFVVISQ